MEQELADVSRKYCLLVSPFIPSGLLSTPKDEVDNLPANDRRMIEWYYDFLPESLKPHYDDKDVIKMVSLCFLLSSSIH